MIEVKYFNCKDIDYVLGAVVALPYRYALVDFPASWMYEPFGTLLLNRNERVVDLSASVRPLSFEVYTNKSQSLNLVYMKIKQIKNKILKCTLYDVIVLNILSRGSASDVDLFSTILAGDFTVFLHFHAT